MDWFLIISLVAIGALFVGFAGYSTMTDKIIRDQEREIARYRTENIRLKAALRGRKYIKDIKLSKVVLDNPPPATVELLHATDDPFKYW